MTSHISPFPKRPQHWSFLGAAFLRFAAPGVEPAAGGRPGRGRGFALQHGALMSCGWVRFRDSGDQCRGVGVGGAMHHRVGVPDFNDGAEIHHRDAGRDLPYHGEVMRDEDVGKIKLLL